MSEEIFYAASSDGAHRDDKPVTTVYVCQSHTPRISTNATRNQVLNDIFSYIDRDRHHHATVSLLTISIETR